MGKDEATSTREERLAAKLRENLKRRKAQARALSDGDGSSPVPSRKGTPLPKAPQKS